MAPVGMLLGKVDFSNLYVNLSGGSYASFAGAQKAGAAQAGARGEELPVPRHDDPGLRDAMRALHESAGRGRLNTAVNAG